MFSSMCRALLEQEDIMRQLTEAPFDVILFENFDTCGTGLAHLLRPTVQSFIHLFGTSERDE